MTLTPRLVPLLLLFTLTACQFAPLTSPPEGNVDISKILEEVNSAITRSIPNDPDFPALTSIQLDLQVSTSASVGATVPINVVSVGPTIDNTRLHKVIIDFVPSAARSPSSLSAPSKEESMLTAAIQALYQSVAHASPVYRLQRGSISLQCTLQAKGSAGLKLIPIQANASASRQVAQTLTINFGRDPNRVILQNDGAGGRATGTSTTGTGTKANATGVTAPTP